MIEAPPRKDAWTECACPVCGRESCEDPLHQHPSGFRRASDIMAEPRPVEIISGIAWADCLTSFTSESGTGKTFCLLAIAGAISDGYHWLARPVTSGSVAYVSYEADSLGVRLRALREAQGRTLDHVYILRASQPLSPVIDRDRLELSSPGETALRAALMDLRDSLTASDLPPIKLIVIDTIRASLSGSEDSSEAVSAYLRAVRRIASTVPGAGVILAHHSGWQDGDNRRKRERGSSAFRGNIDGSLYLELDRYDEETHEARLILRASKVRDDELPPPMYLIRRRVTLTATGQEAVSGRPVTSCIIERDSTTREEREADAAAGDRELDLRVLRIIAERPDLATSQDRIRVAAGLQRNLVCDVLSRMIGLRWIEPPARQRQPYTVSEAGSAALQEAK